MRSFLAGMTSLIPLLTTPPALAAPADFQLGIARSSFSEAYREQELDSRLSAIDQFLFSWSAPLSETDRLLIGVTRAGYQLEDADFPGTRHRRQQTGLMVGARRNVALPHAELGLGLAYALDLMQVESSAKQPGDDPAFLFQPLQAYHGPSMQGEVRIPLIGPVGLRLGAEWQPYVFGRVGDGVLPLPGYLTTYRLDPRVTLWGDRLSFGYALQRTLGQGYDRATSGFLATLSLGGI